MSHTLSVLIQKCFEINLLNLPKFSHQKFWIAQLLIIQLKYQLVVLFAVKQLAHTNSGLIICMVYWEMNATPKLFRVPVLAAQRNITEVQCLAVGSRYQFLKLKSRARHCNTSLFHLRSNYTPFSSTSCKHFTTYHDLTTLAKQN